MLIVAHRILIGTAIVFGVFFTLWHAVEYWQTGATEYLLVAIIAAVITVAMGYYLKNLRRFVA